MLILIADDHRVFREGLKLLLKQISSENEVLEAQNGIEVLEMVKQHAIDVILMDVAMPLMNGVEATKILKKEQKLTIPIIALTMFNQLQDMMAMYDAGVDGYLVKDSSVNEITKAIERVCVGDEYFGESIKGPLLKELLRRESNYRGGNEQLTNREKEVLIMICDQYSTEAIAQALFVSPLTINNHRRNILAKTGAKNVAGLVLYALKQGIYHVE
jgi:DNA-binding NarL/FixJ family response regulator